MNIGSTFAAPPHVSPPRTALPHHAGSLLNLFGFLRASAQPLKISATAATISTKTHLANLELLLQRPYYPPPLPTPNPSKDPDPPNSSTSGGGSLLRALNLPSLFPTSCKQPEEMSPRSLISLHRLLSDSPRPLPRAHIASRWRHYHGDADWVGLLDPSMRISVASSSATATSSRPPTTPSTPAPPPRPMHHTTLPCLTAPTASPAPSSPPPSWRSPTVSTALSPLDDLALHVGRAGPGRASGSDFSSKKWHDLIGRA